MAFLRSRLVPWIFPAVGLMAVVDIGVTFSVLLMEDSGVVMPLGVIQCKAWVFGDRVQECGSFVTFPLGYILLVVGLLC